MENYRSLRHSFTTRGNPQREHARADRGGNYHNRQRENERNPGIPVWRNDSTKSVRGVGNIYAKLRRVRNAVLRSGRDKIKLLLIGNTGGAV